MWGTRCRQVSVPAAPGKEPVKVTRRGSLRDVPSGPQVPHRMPQAAHAGGLCFRSSHPFGVKLLALCKEEVRKSKDVQKLRSSVAV